MGVPAGSRHVHLYGRQVGAAVSMSPPFISPSRRSMSACGAADRRDPSYFVDDTLKEYDGVMFVSNSEESELMDTWLLVVEVRDGLAQVWELGDLAGELKCGRGGGAVWAATSMYRKDVQHSLFQSSCTCVCVTHPPSSPRALFFWVISLISI